MLDGGNGDDTLVAGNGPTVLIGGPGDDVLISGGHGATTFFFSAPSAATRSMRSTTITTSCNQPRRLRHAE